jgi:hypothetical protein
MRFGEQISSPPIAAHAPLRPSQARPRWRLRSAAEIAARRGRAWAVLGCADGGTAFNMLHAVALSAARSARELCEF